jgi:hypothetical protein
VPAFFTMDSAALGLGLSGCECGAASAFSDRNLHSRMPLDPTHVRFEALACVRPIAFLSGAHSSYRFAL